jgi:hypothetical protein
MVSGFNLRHRRDLCWPAALVPLSKRCQVSVHALRILENSRVSVVISYVPVLAVGAALPHKWVVGIND